MSDEKQKDSTGQTDENKSMSEMDLVIGLYEILRDRPIYKRTYAEAKIFKHIKRILYDAGYLNSRWTKWTSGSKTR